MEENVIFQNPVSQPPPPSVPPPQPPASPPVSSVPAGEPGRKLPSIHFSKKLLFGAIGAFLLVIILLIYLIRLLIIPSHFGGDVKLTYWGLWEDSNIMQPIISDFEKENP